MKVGIASVVQARFGREIRTLGRPAAPDRGAFVALACAVLGSLTCAAHFPAQDRPFICSSAQTAIHIQHAGRSRRGGKLLPNLCAGIFPPRRSTGRPCPPSLSILAVVLNKRLNGFQRRQHPGTLNACAKSQVHVTGSVTHLTCFVLVPTARRLPCSEHECPSSYLGASFHSTSCRDALSDFFLPLGCKSSSRSPARRRATELLSQKGLVRPSHWTSHPVSSRSCPCASFALNLSLLGSEPPTKVLVFDPRGCPSAPRRHARVWVDGTAIDHP